MSLYRKYRPNRFFQISGQQAVIRVLSNALARKKPGHAYLLTGPRGTGKTTLARVFAQSVNCLDPQSQPNSQENIIYHEPCGKCANCQLIEQSKTIDIIEIDAASHTGVENIRQLKEMLDLPPGALSYKIYIIDEVHMLSMGAFNALLKTLEEPPSHAIFILATTELHKVPETIISRCQNFTISLLSEEQIVTRLQEVCQRENVNIEKEALEIIALEAGGGMRDALSLLEKIILLEGSGPETEQLITTQETSQILGTSSKNNLINFAQSLASGNVSSGLEQLQNLQREGVGLESFNKNFLSFLRELLLTKTQQATNPSRNSTNTTNQVESSRQFLASQLALTDILFLIEIFQESLGAIKHSPLPQLPLEVATIKFYLQKNPSANTPKNSKETDPSQVESPHPSPEKIITLQENPSVTPPAESESTITPLSSSPKNSQGETGEEIEVDSSSESEPPQDSSQKITKVDPNEPPSSSVNKVQPKDPPKENHPPMPSTESPTPESAKNLPFQSVLENWNSILEQVATKTLSVGGALANCAPFGLDKQNRLLIRAPQEFIRKQLSTPENSKLITAALEKVLGVSPVRTTFFLPAEQENLEIVTDEQIMANQKIIHQALRIFGGKILPANSISEKE
jgi:DNA polymerase-3 subunit gamma/tau